MVGDHGGVFRAADQVGPRSRIVIVVVELLGTVGIADVAPAFAADAVVALVVAGDGGALPLAGGVAELRHEAKPFEVGAGREPAEFDQRGVDVHQLGGLAGAAARGDAGPSKDKGHAGAVVPEGVLAGDSLLTEVPAVVAPDHDDRVLCEALFLEGRQDAADLGVDEAGAGKVGADQIAPLVILADPFQAGLGQVPVEVPREAGRVGTVVLEDLGQDAVVIRIQIEPRLGGVAGHVGQEEAGGEEEGLVAGGVPELVDGPAGDLVIALVLVAVREHAPVHRRVVAHRGGRDELLVGADADAGVGADDLKFARAVGGGGLALGLAAATAGGAGSAVEDLPGGEGAVAVGGEVLRERDAVLPLG